MIPKNVINGVRMSSAMTYLASARARENLTILTDAHACRLIWDDASRCKGIELEATGRQYQIHANKIVLCAGAINTPALLMRSGIGDPAILDRGAVACRRFKRLPCQAPPAHRRISPPSWWPRKWRPVSGNGIDDANSDRKTARLGGTAAAR